MSFSVHLLLALPLLCGTTPVPAKDALALLHEIGKRYADAKSYHIEAVEERTSSNELTRSWQKTLLTAIVMPGGRYRYEGHSGFGGAILVSDGTTHWDYHVNEHLYTQQPVSAVDPQEVGIIPHEEMATLTAKSLVGLMVHRADHLKSATFLADETITVNGSTVDCYVVRYSDEDFKTRKEDLKRDWTLWVDKSRKVVLKTFSKGQTYVLTESHAHIPMFEETTVSYSVVELDQQEPDGSFRFTAPSDAKLVAEFPNLFSKVPPPKAADLAGKPAPELHLKSSDGKIITLSSFRGKPVFLEFWATWCEPCVDLMADLSRLYAETGRKGLVWMSIDNDDDSSTAAEFISREHIPWPNYHDADGSLGEAFHRIGIPLGVLIDADGKITFYQSGYEIAQLRSAIAKLGPQFTSVISAGGALK